MKIDIQVIIAGVTKRDTEYKEKALDKILELSGGWKIEFMLEKDMMDYVLMYLIRMGHKNLNFVALRRLRGQLRALRQPLCQRAGHGGGLGPQEEVGRRRRPTSPAHGGDSDMGSITIIGGGGPTGWEFFTNFDAHDKASIKGTADFFNDTQRWMNEKKLGVDMGHWNQDVRREDGYWFTQEEHDAMFAKLPQPLVTAYQYKVREAINPKNLCGSYYRTLTPSKLDG